jgi:hypothetical protein
VVLLGRLGLVNDARALGTRHCEIGGVEVWFVVCGGGPGCGIQNAMAIFF